MGLIRKIIVPTENTYLLKLSDDMIGKQIEVIVFEIESDTGIDIDDQMKKLDESVEDLKVDLSKFKGNGDEVKKSDE
jgi:hypothetical protein